MSDVDRFSPEEYLSSSSEEARDVTPRSILKNKNYARNDPRIIGSSSSSVPSSSGREVPSRPLPSGSRRSGRNPDLPSGSQDSSPGSRGLDRFQREYGDEGHFFRACELSPPRATGGGYVGSRRSHLVASGRSGRELG